MKARNMILSGVAIVVILITINSVMATPVTVPPFDADPQVYLIKKVFDICDQNGGKLSGTSTLPGGSVPPSSPPTDEGASQSGCVDVIGDRANEYLFSGEQMGILVAVRDLNGAEDITGANLYVDDVDRVMCNLIDPASLKVEVGGKCVTNGGTAGDCTALTTQAGCESYSQGPYDCVWDPTYAYIWFGHNVTADLLQQPPAKSAGTHDGFDPAFDKLYQCVFTATPNDVTGDSGSVVVVKADDQAGHEGFSVPDMVWFNPAITLDIGVLSGGAETDNSLTFPVGTLGQTVYSLNTLQIKNTAEGGVDLVAWMAGTDLFASDGAAKCPDSNVIDINRTMEYRCKIGTIFNNPWTHVPHSNDKEACTMESCQGALPLMPTIWESNDIPSIIANGHTAECWFRFTYPTPICVGNFDQGGEIVIYARAI